jgi:hypothetical protein
VEQGPADRRDGARSLGRGVNCRSADLQVCPIRQA